MRRILGIVALCCAAAGAVSHGGPARAANPYAPAITVNNGVITNYDIDQRMKLLEALGANGDLRKIAVQQLTEDRVKTQAAEDLDIELPDGAIEGGIDEFATSRGLTMDDVTNVLEVRGIDIQTMRDFVSSGLLWREIVAQRFRARALPTEADIDAALEDRQNSPQEILTLAEIAMPFAELGEAETQALANDLYRQLSRGSSFSALAAEYSRSSSAANGGLLEPVPANRLPGAFRTQVLLLSPGQVTRPIPISGGLAIIKLVSIDQRMLPRIPDDQIPAAREELRQQLFSERIQSFGQGYLQELLGDALIVEK
jgi:peptidyl-prolyl cis-trans isomerase SurA